MPHITYKNAAGDRVKSVTAILSLWGDKNGMLFAANRLGQQGLSHRSEWNLAAKLGTLVHEVCSHTLAGMSLDDAVELVSPNVPEAVLDMFCNCVSAWVEAQKQIKFGEPLAIERNMVSEKWQYGGCPDVAITIGEPAILDFKTGGTYPEHVIQVAAYRELYNENTDDKSKHAKAGYLLKLNKKTGGFSYTYLPETTLDGAWQVFRAIQVARERYELIRKAV